MENVKVFKGKVPNSIVAGSKIKVVITEQGATLVCSCHQPSAIAPNHGQEGDFSSGTVISTDIVFMSVPLEEDQVLEHQIILKEQGKYLLLDYANPKEPEVTEFPKTKKRPK